MVYSISIKRTSSYVHKEGGICPKCPILDPPLKRLDFPTVLCVVQTNTVSDSKSPDSSVEKQRVEVAPLWGAQLLHSFCVWPALIWDKLLTKVFCSKKKKG